MDAGESASPLRIPPAPPTAAAAATRSTTTTHRRERLFENAHMRKPRTTHLLWRSLYEIWRLSWYCAPGSNAPRFSTTDVPHTYPRFVQLGEWLVAVRATYDDSGQDAAFLQNANGHKPRRSVAVTAGELLTIAGAQIKARMVTTQWCPQDDTLRYAITPWAGSCVQLCLNDTQQLPQHMRPGVPASEAQLRVCSYSSVRKLGVWIHVSPEVRVYHAQWVEHVLQTTASLAEAICPDTDMPASEHDSDRHSDHSFGDGVDGSGSLDCLLHDGDDGADLFCI